MAVTKYTPEKIEQVATMFDMGWTKTRIAKHMGVDHKTISRWLKKANDPEYASELEPLREQEKNKWVEQAWRICHKISDIIEAQIDHVGFKTVKEAATVLGIYMDKINMIDNKSKRGQASPKPAVQINILPPSPGAGNGDTTRIDANSVQLYDIEGEVCSDDNGGGGRQDVRSLPESRDNVTELPTKSRDDSSQHLQEPQGLRDTDADGGTLGEDGPA